MVHVLLAAAPGPEIAPAVPPSREVALAALAVALVLLLGIWELTGHAIVIAHEGAHAAVALVFGGSPSSVSFDDDGNSLTLYRGGAPPLAPPDPAHSSASTCCATRNAVFAAGTPQ